MRLPSTLRLQSFVVYLRCLVFFELFLRRSARRNLRIDRSYHDAQQHNNTLADGLEVSAEAREAFTPSSSGTGVLRRVRSHSGAQRVRDVLLSRAPRRRGEYDWDAKAVELFIKQVGHGKPMVASLDEARERFEDERIAMAERIGHELTAAVADAEAEAQRQADAALRFLATTLTRREAEEAQLRALLAEPSPSATARIDSEMVKLRNKGLSLREIGERYGLTKQRVGQRLKKYGVRGFTREELAALACVYVATPVDIRSDDGSPAVAAVLEAAEAHGLNSTWLDKKFLKRAFSSAEVKRKQRWKLARDAEIAKSVARGEEPDDIAMRIGYQKSGTGHYPSIAIRKRMEVMGLHQKRKRLKVKPACAQKGIHPFDYEIDAGVAAGESLEHLAARLGVSIMYVSKRARRGTVQVDGAHDERLRELRLEGRQCKDIARTMGESMHWVSNRVTLLGLPPF